MHNIIKGEKMKRNSKDPYNFEKTENFIREYDAKTNVKQPDGKIYMKKQRGKKKSEDHSE